MLNLIKGTVHTKCKFCHHLLTLEWFQTWIKFLCSAE